MPTIQQRTNRFRQELADRETAATGEMIRAYTGAWEAIYAELRELSLRVAVAEGAGLYSPSWVYQENRLRSFAMTVETEIAKLTGTAEGQLSALATDFVAKAEGHTEELIRALMGRIPAGATASFTRLNPAVLENIVAQSGPGSPVAALFAAMPAGTAERASAVLTNGLALGRGMEEVARDLRPEVGGDLVRSIAITRTESLRAYRSAAIANYAANSDVVKGWQWSAQLSRRTCPVCIAMNGSIHPLEEPFGSHVNCFPAGTLVTAGNVLAASSRRYLGEVVTVITASGQTFTTTPNHPVLTPAGWIAADRLTVGSNVISTRDAKAVSASVSPNDDNIPALIEEVGKASFGAFPVRRAIVPVAAVDFHGDRTEGKVSIVSADSFLSSKSKSALQQPFLQEQFGRIGAYKAFFVGQGAAAESFPTVGTTTPRFLGGGGIQPVFFRGSGNRQQPVSVSVTPNGNLQVAQYASDNHARSAMFLRELHKRHAGNIFTDKIVSVKRKPFVGQVYNLQTESGWYSVNNSIQHNAGVCQGGVIVHNCRCIAIPYTASWAELGFSDMAEDVPELEIGADWLERQGEDTQKAILGPGKLELYQSGAISLTDIVGYREDATWGGVRYERSIKDIDANGARPGGINPINPVGIRPSRLFPAPAIFKPSVAPRVARSRKAVKPPVNAPSPELSAQEVREGIGRIQQEELDKVLIETDPKKNTDRYMFAEVKRRIREELLYQDQPAAIKVKRRGQTEATKERNDLGIDAFRKLIGKSAGVDGKEVLVKATARSRSYYDNLGSVLMSKFSNEKIVVHELGHWLENVSPDIHAEVIDFYARRTQGEKAVSLADLTGLSYKASEITKPDKFIDFYMGKLYLSYGDQFATEILSMGLELMYDDPTKLAEEDPDYFDFIFNVVRRNVK